MWCYENYAHSDDVVLTCELGLYQLCVCFVYHQHNMGRQECDGDVWQSVREDCMELMGLAVDLSPALRRRCTPLV